LRPFCPLQSRAAMRLNCARSAGYSRLYCW
jgi:hypothetical protein